jgi:hypothetical protein
VTERYGTARFTSSWPRAAWYLASQGRWGLKQVRAHTKKSAKRQLLWSVVLGSWLVIRLLRKSR